VIHIWRDGQTEFKTLKFAYKIRVQNIFYAHVIHLSNENFVGTVPVFFVYINGIAVKISLKIKHTEPPKKFLK